MQIEQLVCDLEYAKRLRELGVKQSSLFYWSIKGVYVPGFSEDEEPNTIIYHTEYNNQNKNSYAAFTTPELGEMLPDWTETVKRMKDDWVCIVRHKYNDVNDYAFAQTEADARAKMLIYLLENGLVKAEDLK